MCVMCKLYGLLSKGGSCDGYEPGIEGYGWYIKNVERDRLS